MHSYNLRFVGYTEAKLRENRERTSYTECLKDALIIGCLTYTMHAWTVLNAQQLMETKSVGYVSI